MASERQSSGQENADRWDAKVNASNKDPISSLGTTIDRYAKINLFAAVTLLLFLATVVWVARGFFDSVNNNIASVNDNTQSIKKMTMLIQQVVDQGEANREFSTENRGRIQGIENEMDLMRRRESE